jgi:hypothetical protein
MILMQVPNNKNQSKYLELAQKTTLDLNSLPMVSTDLNSSPMVLADLNSLPMVLADLNTSRTRVWRWDEKE